MNTTIKFVKVVGPRLDRDGDRPIYKELKEYPILDEDEFDLNDYIRKLEEKLNNPEIPNEEWIWIKERIESFNWHIDWFDVHQNGEENFFIVM